MAKAKKTAEEIGEETQTPHEVTTYAEWDVKITGSEFEKLKISRPRIVISDEEAETLNTGILTGGNTYAKMYFKND